MNSRKYSGGIWINRFAAGAIVFWIIVIAASLAWNWRHVGNSMMTLAETEARLSFEKDLVYRRWVAMQGGVYVRPTDITPPNPFLSHLPDRDITTTDGETFTLVNPAYMTRQVHELFSEQYGLKGHITSLNPLRPGNATDAWEKKALQAFNTGAKEIMSVETMGGRPYLRLMRPMITEAGCLECHAAQGYKEGDIRGGISVSTPLTHYIDAAGKQRFLNVQAHLLIGGLGLIVILLGSAALRRSDKTLRESEGKYQSLFNNAQIALFRTSISEGKLIEINKRYAQMTGYKKVEDCMAEFNAADAWADPKARVELIELLQEKGFVHDYEGEFIRRDGTHFWILFSAEILPEQGFLEGSIVDITDRKKAENALRESEARYRRLAENSPAVVYQFKMTPEGEYAFPYVSRAILNMLGIPPGDVTRDSSCLLDKIHPMDQDWFPESVLKSAETLEPWDETLRLLIDGKEKWIEGHSTPEPRTDGSILWDGFFFDITDRKAAEKALRQRAAFEQLVGEIASDMAGASGAAVDRRIDRALASIGSFTCVDRAYIFQFRNGDARMDNTHEWCSEGIEPQIAHLNKIPLDEELPYFAERVRRFETFHVPDVTDLPPEASFEREHLEAQGIQSCVVVPMETGGRILGFIGFDAVRERRAWSGDDESLLRFVGSTMAHVIERRQSEEERIDMERRLQQTEKAESLSRLAGAVAHHFNNMLAAVIGNLELVREDLPPGTDAAEKLAEAERAAHRAAEMSGLMLTFLGMSEGKPSSLDLGKTCNEHMAQLRADVPAGVVVSAALPLSGPVIEADPAHINQILSALVTNAWEALNGASGKVRISVGAVKAAEIQNSQRFPMEWTASGDAYACLTVTDTGRGMDAGTIGRIFDPFYTDKFIGRGLGLSVTLGVVRSLGGCVTVESKPGSGSTFRVFLPRASEDVPRTEEDKAEDDQPAVDGKIVLLVDDDEIVRNVAERMLERLGFDVLTAANGEEAVETFQSRQVEIRLVLTDVSMPRMNGWETISAIRAIRPDIRAILASGYDEAEIVKKEHDGESLVFLPKPYRMAALEAALEKALGGLFPFAKSSREAR